MNEVINPLVQDKCTQEFLEINIRNQKCLQLIILNPFVAGT